MMCYRDMTFCPYHEDCEHASQCHRPLTDEVREKASAWWGGEAAPIAFYTQKPPCHSSEKAAEQ